MLWFNCLKIVSRMQVKWSGTQAERGGRENESPWCLEIRLIREFSFAVLVQLLVVSIIIASPSTCHINSDSFTWKLVLVTQTMLNLTASTSHNLSSPYLPLTRPIVLAHQKLRLPPSAHRVMITFDFIVNIFLVRIRFYRGMEIGNFIPPIAYTRRNKKLTQRQFHSFHDDSIRLLNWSRLRGEYLLYVRKETKEKYYERHKGI